MVEGGQVIIADSIRSTIIASRRPRRVRRTGRIARGECIFTSDTLVKLMFFVLLHQTLKARVSLH